MNAASAPAESIRFGLFEYDPRAQELRKQGIPVKLHGQPVQILELLLSRPGQVVSREELQSRLWQADTFVDFDRSLNAAIKRLRFALGDSAEAPRYIETLARRGYRFIAPVDKLRSPAVELLPAPLPSASLLPGEHETRASKRFRVRLVALIAVAAISTLAVVLYLMKRDGNLQQTGSLGRITSLAVLPLKSLSAEPEHEFFADGLTDALNARLSAVRVLRVISQTSSSLYKGTSKPLSQIARELNVDAVVEGTVVLSGDRVRITVQLINPDGEKRIWGRTYERDVRDVLAVQSEVTRAIVDEIRIRLTPGEEARLASVRTTRPEAHIAYAKGRFFWNKRTEEGLRKAVEFFELAIEYDPGYALAYVGLADSWVPKAWYAYVPAKDAFPHAKDAVTKALQLDPELAEAHTTLAFINLYYDWDWEAADREFRRAIELNPNYANAHHWYAEYLSLVGQHENAIREAERARELDPVSSIINTWVGSRYFFAGQYDRALQQYRNVVEQDPNFVPALLALGHACERNGMFSEAIAKLEKAVNLSGGSPVYIASLAHAYGVAGRQADSARLIRDLQRTSTKRYVASFDMAIAWLGFGDRERALTALHKAVEDRSPRTLFLMIEPRFEPLRSDPRFQSLVKKLGTARQAA